MINANFEDAASQPILTTIDTVDVTSIPFPAVTVIPGNLLCFCLLPLKFPSPFRVPYYSVWAAHKNYAVLVAVSLLV